MNTEAPITREGISRHWLLKTLLTHHTKVHEVCVGSEVSRHHLRLTAIKLARAVEERYRSGLNLPAQLSTVQFIAMLSEIHVDLQVPVIFQYANEEEIVFIVEQCPWEDLTGEVPGYCYLMMCVYGVLTAGTFDYARVSIEQRTIEQQGCCLLRMKIRPHDEEVSSDEVVFSRQEIEDINNVYPSRDGMMTNDPGKGQTSPEEFETLYHQQLQLTERLEQALEMERTAAEQLRAFNRLKQDFLSNVSHEFRTPITAIQGYLSLLEQGALGDLSLEQTDALRIVLRNTDRLNRLVNDVLDFSSLSRGQFLLEGEIVEVATVLTSALQRATESANIKGIKLCYEPVESPGRVMGDEERLVQMITHLLENAIKFSESGQQVRLSVSHRPHQVAIEINDEGIGMTQEQLAHVFTPFVQGDSGLSRRYGGLGMGLSLIHNLVALHGGEINIDSEPGQGTMVVITLPLLDA